MIVTEPPLMRRSSLVALGVPQVLRRVLLSIKQELIVDLNYSYAEICHYSIREVITVFSQYICINVTYFL